MSRKSKSTQVTHNEVTPTNPTWVEDPNKALTGQVADLSKLDPYSLVSGADPLTTQAGQAASGLGTSPDFGKASDLFSGVAGAGANTYAPAQAQAASLLDNLQAYMSPYTKDVVDTSLADYDFGAGQSRAQADLDMANGGAFGGSGAAISKSMTEDALTRGRGTLSAGLRDTAFQRGAALSSDDANRRQSVSLANMGSLNSAGQFNAGQQDANLQRQLAAGQGLSGNAQAMGGEQRANINTQAQIGDILRQIDSQHRMAPVSLLSTQVGLNGQMPYNLFHGQTEDGTNTTTTKTSDPLGSIGSLAMGIGGLMAAPLTGGLSLGALGGLGGIGGMLGGAAGAAKAFNLANIGG